MSDPANKAEARVSEIGANDIATSIGTLIGLLFAGFGLLAYAPHLASDSFVIIGKIALIMMVPFSITATTAAYSTVTGRLDAQEVARGIYPVSWVVFCAGVFSILAVLIAGAGPFTVTIPLVNETTDWLTPIIIAVGVVTGIVVVRRSLGAARGMLKMREQIQSQSEDSEDEADMEDELGKGVYKLLKKWGKLEKSIQEASKALGIAPDRPANLLVDNIYRSKKKITPTDAVLFKAAFNVRNRIAHGGVVLPGDLKSATATMDLLQKTFSKVEDEAKKEK